MRSPRTPVDERKRGSPRRQTSPTLPPNGLALQSRQSPIRRFPQRPCPPRPRTRDSRIEASVHQSLTTARTNRHLAVCSLDRPGTAAPDARETRRTAKSKPTAIWHARPIIDSRREMRSSHDADQTNPVKIAAVTRDGIETSATRSCPGRSKNRDQTNPNPLRKRRKTGNSTESTARGRRDR